jgi:hypothetical protein
MTTIPNWPAQVLRQLDGADARARSLTEGLSPDDLNWKPADGAWSIGQCLEHLSLGNEVYIAPMLQALEGRAPHPVDAIVIGWFGRWFLRSYIEPDTQKARSKAPSIARPVAGSVDLAIVNRFVASNAAIRAVVERARDRDVNRIRFRNPFAPVVRFTLGTGFWILARHNHRHLGQAERVRQALGR